MTVSAKPFNTDPPKIHMDFGSHGICRGIKMRLAAFSWKIRIMPLSGDNLLPSVLDLEQSAQNAPQGFGRFPDDDVHTRYTPFYRLQQARPQAISTQATKNISIPTGKIAAIRIPAPSATAKMPMYQQFPGPRLHIRPASSRPTQPKCRQTRGHRLKTPSMAFHPDAPLHRADYHSISARAVQGAGGAERDAGRKPPGVSLVPL